MSEDKTGYGTNYAPSITEYTVGTGTGLDKGNGYYNKCKLFAGMS